MKENKSGIEIIGKRDNIAIGREEYYAVFHFHGPTPSRNDVKNAIVSKVGKSSELIVIKKLEQHAGENKLKITFYVYKDAEVLKRVEPIYILKREGLIKEEKA